MLVVVSNPNPKAKINRISQAGIEAHVKLLLSGFLFTFWYSTLFIPGLAIGTRLRDCSLAAGYSRG